jgi:membrane-bound lytic murein transglycosylase D
MAKKVLTLLLLSVAVLPAIAEDVSASNFMLNNNYNVRNSSDIWQRMRQGFRIDFKETSRVRYYEKMYSRNQTAFDRVMRNSSLYLYYVLSAVERYGLPSELALIPIIESNYDSMAVNSTGRYDGIWQFVPATAGDFGLSENSAVNDRRNIAKATTAAMLYFNYLNLTFKQWDVAIGAYNWGQGNIYKAIVNSNQKIGSVDYNQLELREITANYVPKIIALANIIKNPQRFGIKLPDLPNEPVFAITKPSPGITVANLIKTAEVDSQTFKVLNAHYKTTSYVLNNQSITVLPIANQNTYLATQPQNNQAIQLAHNDDNDSDNQNMVKVNYSNLANNSALDDAINQIGYEKTQPTNTNPELKTAANVTFKPATADEINQLANSDDKKEPNLTKDSTTNSNTTLIVPKYANQTVPKPSLANDNNSTTNTKVLTNDLVADISNTTKLSHTNKKTNKKLANATKHYKVHKGDTLYSIAKKFDVALAELKQTNRIRSNQVKTGQILVIR